MKLLSSTVMATSATAKPLAPAAAKPAVSPLLCLLARAFDWGHASVQTAVEDYGTKFLIVGGLLNIISAIDAHSLASGRKAS
jgi:hypothetical protein